LEEVALNYDSAEFVLKIPPLGEGDKGLVYPVKSTSLNLPGATGRLCLKVAKQHQVCRNCLLEESRSTAFFLSEHVAVPPIYHMDPLGRFAVKELIEGESITSLYLRFNSLTVRAQSLVLRRLEQFLNRLLELFEKRPDLQSEHQSEQHLCAVQGRTGFSEQTEFVLIDPGLCPRRTTRVLT